MSRRATDWAWRQDIKATKKLILLSLADRADEYHRAYPSAERIELDTRLNIKTIRSNLKVMQELGIIRDSGKRKGSTKQVVVWELLGIEDDVKHQVPKSSRTTSPEEKVPKIG
ncbi:TPA: helix-turn-helix domain-containing protein [Vibrio parahaemolyticus]|uniref:helix-turn-helix domain-containing protein n=1 Tax=Vibrio parahaemolyticus TaxID=670 RepID=UPI001E2C19BE|nr:helix-turn-helix domain-containing protein [Vibrio parahaemolyticus]HCE2126620.1 helix-turn-helix domain-containing protein [Vibrio parahaemolyticus]HCE3217468.1 helix-turn-helix domain-containing protein [Vibrio parahaemolyticus]HCG8214580.1 helix-turn-helix domain-containing protein [Vibrio parahaemolyticus]HCM0849047.1 helix-turn-helix domain-containing protein [Vibrio parahaemolyticus]